MGGPRREIERACDRDERRAGLSDRARDKEDQEPAAARARAEGARETNDETAREDAAAGRAREKEWKSGESPVVGRVTNNTRMRLG